MNPDTNPAGRIILTNLALFAGACAIALLFPSQPVIDFFLDWIARFENGVEFAALSTVKATIRSYQLRLFLLVPFLAIASWYVNIRFTGTARTPWITWLTMSVILMIIGASIYWFWLGPKELGYLASFNLPILYTPSSPDQPSLSWTYLISLFMKSASLSMLPLLVMQYLFAVWKGWLSPANLKRGFVGAAVIPWVVAFLFTPPSLMSTVLMGVPLMALAMLAMMVAIGISPDEDVHTANRELFAWAWLAPWIFMAIVAAI